MARNLPAIQAMKTKGQELLERLRYHVTGAIERGEAEAITEQRATHTPGPWESHGCAIYQEATWQDGNKHGGAWIAQTFEDSSDACPTEEQIANAHLIAAAPAMLEALEYIVGWNPDDWNPERARTIATAAIAQAKGAA